MSFWSIVTKNNVSTTALQCSEDAEIKNHCQVTNWAVRTAKEYWGQKRIIFFKPSFAAWFALGYSWSLFFRHLLHATTSSVKQSLKMNSVPVCCSIETDKWFADVRFREMQTCLSTLLIHCICMCKNFGKKGFFFGSLSLIINTCYIYTIILSLS